MPLKPSNKFISFLYVNPAQNCHFDEGENSTKLPINLNYLQLIYRDSSFVRLTNKLNILFSEICVKKPLDWSGLESIVS